METGGNRVPVERLTPWGTEVAHPFQGLCGPPLLSWRLVSSQVLQFLDFTVVSVGTWESQAADRMPGAGGDLAQ